MVDATGRKPMTEKPNPEKELLLEARRTTHAVRAIARFVLLIVTYQVFATITIGLGVAITAAGNEDGAIGFIVVGALISITGLIHSLVAGHDELSLSDRNQSVPASDATTAESQPEFFTRELLPGVCSCRKLTRWANSGTKDGVKYCMACWRAVPE